MCLITAKSLRNNKCSLYSSSSTEFKLLPADFVPGSFDVICARGKVPFSHSGNMKFRQLIEETYHEYSKATTKSEKSDTVSKVVDKIRHNSPNGGFVKFCDGKWYEVSDRLAREKVGQG